ERRFIGWKHALEFHPFTQCLFDIQLARNRQNDIVRPAVLLYVRDDIVTPERAQAFGGAGPPTFHPMLLKSGLLNLLGRTCRWIVELPIVLLENDFDFLFEFAGVVDGIQKRIGLNLQSLFQVLGWYFSMVNGAIVIRVRVQISAERLGLTSDLTNGTLR